MKMGEYAIKQYAEWFRRKYGEAEPQTEVIRLLGVVPENRGGRDVVCVVGEGMTKFSAFRNVWEALGVDLEPLQEGDRCEVTFLQAPGEKWKNLVGFRKLEDGE